jgi:hypothetical protein
MTKIFNWVLAPGALVLSFLIVESRIDGRSVVILASFLSGCTLGLYYGLLLWKRRKGG